MLKKALSHDVDNLAFLIVTIKTNLASKHPGNFIKTFQYFKMKRTKGKVKIQCLYATTRRKSNTKLAKNRSDLRS